MATVASEVGIRGVCFDLYSTLAHESPENPFYRRVADDLDLDFSLWYPCYRARGADAMSGRLPGMSGRVWQSAQDSGQPRPLEDVRRAVGARFCEFVD
ncbi:MAG: hypothetical protein ABR613_09820, partial [Actinomycetota bacterium]